eukprot:scaffold315093_cov32-Tisochrysis_lutea.AAC.1
MMYACLGSPSGDHVTRNFSHGEKLMRRTPPRAHPKVGRPDGGRWRDRHHAETSKRGAPTSASCCGQASGRACQDHSTKSPSRRCSAAQTDRGRPRREASGEGSRGERMAGARTAAARDRIEQSEIEDAVSQKE